MSTVTMPAWRERVSQRAPGVLICGVVAVAAMALGAHYGAPVMLFALLLGMALNFLSREGPSAPGIEFTARSLLRLGVALLGLRITLAQVVELGWEPVAMVVVSVAATVSFGIVLARWMGFRVFFGLLTGGAVAICGASAALALSAAMPMHPLKERATLFTVIGVSTLSTLAMVLYPPLTHMLDLSTVEAGAFIGGTIHDVAQVVGAGYSLSHEAGDAATLVKLMRVAMLLPAVALAAWLSGRYLRTNGEGGESGARPPLLPGFAIGFAALVAINSTGWIPRPVVLAGQSVSQFLLVAAMGAIGMKTHLRELATVGWKPVALMVAETAFLAALFWGLIRAFA
ncbi:MAG: putative sulfate exporter family transporter [Burkholderiaceae bacterium]